MPETFNQIAESIMGGGPSLSLRIATITELEVGGTGRVRTDLTSTAWVIRDAEITVGVGDSVWLLQQGATWLVAGRLSGAAAVPIGTVSAFAGSAAPPGWLMCDGSIVSRTDWAKLFAVIGTTYGAGNGTTTFSTPNLAGRFPLGSGGPWGRGSQGGAQSVTLTKAQMPAHNHGESSQHVHYSGYGASTVQVQSGSGVTVANGTGGNTAYAGAHTHATEGGGAAHENMPPFLTIPYIIRAL